jgi:hypothetical protein
MIRLFLVFFSLGFLGFHSYGQQQGLSKLVWKVNRIDLGTILQEQGLQSVTFDYILSQGAAFAIEEILTDCGCTTIKFSKDSIAVGQSGKVLIDFDPSSSFGFFSKLVLVKGNKGQVQDSLYVEGIAVPYPSNLERNYPVKLGSLGFRMKKVNMGDVFDNEPKEKFLEFFNYGSQPLEKKNLQVKSPDFIKVEQVQELVRPKERGLLKIDYSASLRSELGAVSDQIQINWVNSEAIELTILADLFDYFAPISKSDLEKVPQLFLAQKVIDLGEISSNTVRRQTVVLTNLGKQDLEIREIQENCSCLVLEFPKNVLLPGEKMELNLVFDPMGRKGIDQRNIYIFSNDPVNPVQLLVLKSRID